MDTDDLPKQNPRRLRRLNSGFIRNEDLRSFLVTLCIQDRKKVLASKGYFENLQGFLVDSPSRYGWFPTLFVIMPDHIHLMANESCQAVRIGDWIKALKSVTKRKTTTDANAEWRWQSGFHDHLLRSEKSMEEKVYYLTNNPVRAGLVTIQSEWEFGGRIVYPEKDGPVFETFQGDRVIYP